MDQTIKKVPISEDIVGSRLAQHVYSKNANYIFISKGALITSLVYLRLIEEGIEEIAIYSGEIQKPFLAAPQKKFDIKSAQLKQVERIAKLNNLFNEIIINHKLNIDETSKICAEIIYSSNDKYNVFLMLDSLRLFDDYLYSHSVNVATLAGLFGKWLKFPESEIELLTMCGLLHDIGKTVVDASILKKTGKLTPDEFSEIKKHTIKGYKILQHQDVAQEVKEVAYMHHEKLDGTGYPRALKNEQIAEYAKIIAIADIFDAMSHARVYRAKAYSPFQILKEFQREVYGKLDMQYLYVFTQNIAYMYTGAKCVLSDGRKGRVVFVNPVNLSSPIVEIEGAMIDLQFERNLIIDNIIMT